MNERRGSGERWLKAELHSHCSSDPVDYRLCEYSPEQLISEAARHGYDVLAITCHNLDIWNRKLSDFAESLGITLIPGMEVAVEGRRHALAYNFHTGCENLNTFDKMRARSRHDTLVVAPHAYFPGPSCLRKLLEKNVDLFDAIESSGFYILGVDFNRQARKTAAKYGRPMVGSSDAHRLWQLNRTFTWIYSEPSVAAILNAVKRGLVRIESNSLAYSDVARWWSVALWRRLFPVHPAPTHVLGPFVPERGRSW